VWSAGCASGEEPYSLALLFAVHAGRRGAARLARRLRIDATDLDPAAVEQVGRAAYPASALAQAPAPLVARYFSPGPPYRLDPAIVRLVRPLAHDLTRDGPPEPPYHLIVCRNVVIYFDRPTQQRLFSAFADALVPGGRLVLGKVETLVGPARSRLELEDARERVFRRP
jgi:chemotaxis methyl-accepting protein methylase